MPFLWRIASHPNARRCRQSTEALLELEPANFQVVNIDMLTRCWVQALAERAAWDWRKSEGGGMEMSVVNPVRVLDGQQQRLYAHHSFPPPPPLCIAQHAGVHHAMHLRPGIAVVKSRPGRLQHISGHEHHASLATHDICHAVGLQAMPSPAPRLTRAPPAAQVGIFGPVLAADYSASVSIVQRLMDRQMPAVPRLGFGLVDVRDAAELHLMAMTRPEAKGQRFLAVAGPSMTLQVWR